MADKRKLLNSLLMLFGIIVAIALILLPLPVVVVDILIALNLTQSIFITLIVILNDNSKNFSYLPSVLLLSSVFGLICNISSARLILTRGAAINSRILRIDPLQFTGFGETVDFIAGFAGITVVIVVMIIVINKKTGQVSEAAERFALDTCAIRHTLIDSSGTIDQSEALSRKKALQKEFGFLGAMDSAVINIVWCSRVMIFIAMIIICGGTAIDVLIRGEETVNAVKANIFISINSCFPFIFPVFLLSMAASSAIIGHRAGRGRTGDL